MEIRIGICNSRKTQVGHRGSCAYRRSTENFSTGVGYPAGDGAGFATKGWKSCRFNC